MGGIINRRPKNEEPDPLMEPINKETSDSLVKSLMLQEFKPHTPRMQRKLEDQMQLTEKKLKTADYWYAKVYFTPECKFILLFKTITLALIYLYFLEIPITIAFEKHRNSDESQRIFEYINIPAIIFLVLGVFIKMKTGFYKEGILISDQREILINYFLYIFIFDFLSIISIVIYEFSEILRDKSSSLDPNPYRFIVILFYLKIPQVFSIQKSIISSFDLNRRIKAFFKLVLLMVKIFMLSNIAACCFFYISDSTCPMEACSDCCWIYELQILNKPLKDADWSIQYTFSLYWASTTMLTIGYGDITPQNLPEAVYTVAAQFISCVLFAFSINEIWSIIQEKNAKRFKIHSRMNVINVYMRDKNVSPELKSHVNAYLSHFYHTKNLRQKQLQNEIISELTPSLRKQLFFQSYGFLFHTHPFFKNFSDQFLEHVSENIREVGFFQQEIVYEPQIKEGLSLYYIHKGELESFVELGNSRTRNMVLEQFQKGTIVGLFEFVRQLNYCSSLMALKYCLLYVLDFENWSNCLKEYDENYQKFFVIKHKAQYEQKYKKLGLMCRLCGSQKHQTDMCLNEEITTTSSQFLQNYLRKSQRKPYLRRNFKTLADIKSQHFQLEPTTSSPRMQRVRKASVSLRKQMFKAQSNKKSIFHKKTHHEKMNVIIQKKMKESVWSEESESDDEIISQVVMMIDSVQNYQYYWPAMNATTTDWGKERRRQTFNRMLFKA